MSDNIDEKPVLANFTTEDADRLLGLADQFLEDWRSEFDDGDSEDERILVREKEWDAIRPLLAAAPLLLRACRQLADAYKAGEENGGSIEWDDVDLAHEWAQEAILLATKA